MVYETLIANASVGVIAGIATGLVRAIGGWAKHALEDGKISKPEWKLLGATMVKYIAYVSILMLGLPVEQAVITTFGLDVLKNSLEKMGNKR